MPPGPSSSNVLSRTRRNVNPVRYCTCTSSTHGCQVPDRYKQSGTDSNIDDAPKPLLENIFQVRKTSQAALLVLLEQGLVETTDVVNQVEREIVQLSPDTENNFKVCPVILRLTDADSVDDYRTEAVALLSKMAPLIGKENSEKIFLDR